MNPTELKIVKELVAALEDHIKGEAALVGLSTAEVCPCEETTLAQANALLLSHGVSPDWRKQEGYVR